ncbi:hypothetical protein KKC13_08025, partial [bacterium]|nr:hypothetical protein [bacterium]MBU1958502.1 hypothetical protein [bacterium]
MDNRNELFTLWLPLTDFSSIKKIVTLEKKSIENVPLKKSVNRPWNVENYTLEAKNTKYTIDSLGFIYIETEKLTKTEVIKVLYDDILSKNIETIKLIQNTFLNNDILCKEKKKVSDKKEFEQIFKDFLEKICIKFNTAEKIRLEYLEYSVDFDSPSKENDTKIKEDINLSRIKFSVTSPNNLSDFDSIINRNFKKLLKKSLFYSHGLEYDKNESYELDSLANSYDLSLSFLLNINENGVNKESKETKKILESILKKALQDTIEEKTLLEFLEQTKDYYLRSIFSKISEVN